MPIFCDNTNIGDLGYNRDYKQEVYKFMNILLFLQILTKAEKRIAFILKVILVGLFLSSCIMNTDEYDSAQDDGTYTGTMAVYDGPGTDPDFIDRTCPNIDVTLVVADGVAVLTANDTYPNYVHHSDVVTNHVASGDVYDNNKFQLRTGWKFEETDTQLEDLMTLGICDSSAPSFPGDTSTGDRGRLKDMYLSVDDRAFVGEFGQGIARGSLWYGVRCNDGEEIPFCLYFMQLKKR